tara:strand:+ start:400 stop:813 length:414 start_codon:yes stop_codon:yes gene_type:complete
MLLPHEVIEKLRETKKKADKVQILKDNESWALKDIIKGSMDPIVKWNLPGGSPPYTAARPESAAASILRENRKFKYLFKGGEGDRLPAYKRESIFLGILEGIHPGDAELVVAMINKETIKPLTKALVNEAFPGLLSA